MRIRRDVSSIPVRSASETWRLIVDLITGPDSKDKAQLDDALGVMASIIADETPASEPMIVEGVGSQLRLYCRYAAKAVEADDAVSRLNWNPTAGDWSMHVPCDGENLSWVRESLKTRAPRIKVFDVKDGAPTKDEGSSNEAATLVVDWNAKD